MQFYNFGLYFFEKRRHTNFNSNTKGIVAMKTPQNKNLRAALKRASATPAPTTEHVSFELPEQAHATVREIVQRACALFRGKFSASEKMDIHMDITAIAANDPRNIELGVLLDADDFDFMHDIMGIQNNIDRKTGMLGNCFIPRHVR